MGWFAIGPCGLFCTVHPTVAVLYSIFILCYRHIRLCFVLCLGYFTITEKCADFCQEDLPDDDVMLLDSGAHVFVWVGRRASDVELKLALRSAQLYVQYCRLAQADLPRTLKVIRRGHESPLFTRCFHAWVPWSS